MDIFYIMLMYNTYGYQVAKDKQKECWEIFRLMLRVSLRDMQKFWVGAETIYSSPYPYMCVGKYMWHTLQTLRTMGCFKAGSFQKHTHIYPSIFNHLSDHRASKLDATTLKGKIKEHRDEVNRLAKEMKLLRSMVNFIKEKLVKAKKGN